jgi:two-component system phosphate regulon sensor histidine kinase PhoR
LRARVNVPLLEQALVNLVDNAVKYSEPGKSVTVEAALRDGALVIQVRDEGPGIEREHLPRIFERFYRVDKGRSREMGGTGLGLSIVKHIAQAHGGSVAVQSEPGQGSLFTLTLPSA